MRHAPLKFGSVCSGIEAASVAWEPIGMEPIWFSEIENFPSKVLSHRWPNVPNHGDMTRLVAKILDKEIDAPDVLVGGTPCQAFSIAGLRNGLEDPRGNLTLTYVEILNAIDHVRLNDGREPAYCVWENVPGVLSDKTNAFGSLLAGLVGEERPLVHGAKRWPNQGLVVGPRRSVAWRVLDAQYFGVPQRRKRVFVVCGTRGESIAQVLFEQEGLRWDSEESKSKRACFTTSFGEGVGISYFENHPADSGIRGPLTVANSVTARYDTGGGNVPIVLSSGQANAEISYDKAGSLTCLHETQICCHDETIRRLTPTECERLQGFPDGHTDIPGSADSHRYKALGNSMAVPCMRFIGERLKKLYCQQSDKAEGV